MEKPWVIVRGAGDLATGVIVRLARCGFRVCALESSDPTAIRRKAAFCQAVWQGRAEVEGLVCVKAESPRQAQKIWEAGQIPLLVDETAAAVQDLHAAAVVDAIIAKKNLGTSRAMAPITIGLGPGFTAGVDVDAVVETQRGHHLGRLILEGSAAPNTGIPGNIGGYTSQRVIHAPAHGQMRFVRDQQGKTVDIGALVSQGQVIALVGDTPVYATLTGVLRGLIRPGYPVTQGLKIADIDPRLEQAAFCDTVSDKARSIGGGVVEGLLLLSARKEISLL